MKIIYYSPHPTHDIVSEVGYATHQREIINALKGLGHQVFPVIMGGTEASNLSPLAKGDYKPPMWKRLVKSCVPRFLWTSFNNYKLLRHDKLAAERLESEIISIQPDLIYERSEYLQDSGARISKKYGIRHILEVNAPFVEEMRAFEGYSLFEGKAHLIEKFKLEKADKVIAVSTSLADFLFNRYACDRKKIFVQPNCINPGKLVVHEEKSLRVRKQLELEADSKVIGFVGSMFPYHGVDVLIDAFVSVVRSHPHSRLLIVGDGVILTELKIQAKTLGLDGKVIFTGKVPHTEVFDYMSNMDICIMAKSNWYGSPVKLFEYGLMNKPIVAPDTGPVLDVMVHEHDALLVSENKDELANSINRLIENPEFANTLASNFHRKVLDSYTWETAAKNIIDLCE